MFNFIKNRRFNTESHENLGEDHPHRHRLAYAQVQSPQETIDLIKIVATYLIIIVAWVLTSSVFYGFVRVLIDVAVVGMLGVGTAVSIFLGDEREANIKHTKLLTTGYIGLLYIYRIILGLLSNIAPEDMGTSLGANVPLATANTLSGFYSNLFIFLAIGYPLAAMIFFGNKFKIHGFMKTKQEFYAMTKQYTSYGGQRAVDEEGKSSVARSGKPMRRI